MAKLEDYSGGFLPNPKPGDFSPDTLTRLVKLYSRLYVALDGFWYLTVKDRVNNDEAMACDIRVWEIVTRYEMVRITRELNIQGNDVVALMKALQFTPWFQSCEYRIEIKGPDYATITFTVCPTLNALEKEGEGRENQICNIVDRKILQKYADFFDPAIKVKSLISPPRKNKDGICCEWEFTREPG